MQLTIQKIMDAREGLESLLSFRLPAKAAYRVQRALDKVLSRFNAFDKVRQRILEGYLDPATGKVPDEKMPAFLEELEPLLTEEIEIDIHPVPLSMVPNLELPVRQMLQVAFLFEDDEAPGEYPQPEDD